MNTETESQLSLLLKHYASGKKRNLNRALDSI